MTKDPIKRRASARRGAHRALLKKHGLTESQYQAMLKKQNHRCAICKREGKLLLDHDHASTFVRGLLCCQCNTILGMAGDSPRILASAIVYLEEYGIRLTLSGAWEEG